MGKPLSRLPLHRVERSHDLWMRARFMNQTSLGGPNEFYTENTITLYLSLNEWQIVTQITLLLNRPTSTLSSYHSLSHLTVLSPFGLVYVKRANVCLPALRLHPNLSQASLQSFQSLPSETKPARQWERVYKIYQGGIYDLITWSFSNKRQLIIFAKCSEIRHSDFWLSVAFSILSPPLSKWWPRRPRLQLKSRRRRGSLPCRGEWKALSSVCFQGKSKSNVYVQMGHLKSLRVVIRFVINSVAGLMKISKDCFVFMGIRWD